ncbi:hypothetical protein RND81_14G090900 [Saponaria officinalis]|uniref:Uncharacterized protein n=1 Tax=Saponaria officinalis TaxID=3572 RepID=A0AAW1GQ46_SAPOF
MMSSRRPTQNAYKISGLVASPLISFPENVVKKKQTSSAAMILGLHSDDSTTTMIMTSRQQAAALSIIGGFPTPIHPLGGIRRIHKESCDHFSVLVINQWNAATPVNDQRSSVGVLGHKRLSPSKRLFLALRKHYCKWKRKVRSKFENKSSFGAGDITSALGSTGMDMDTDTMDIDIKTGTSV